MTNARASGVRGRTAVSPSRTVAVSAAATVVLLLTLSSWGIGSSVATDARHASTPIRSAGAITAAPEIPAGNRSWVNLTPDEAVGPTAWDGSTAVWDAALHGILLFGGSAGPRRVSNLTWLYRNGSWTELHPATSPPAVSSATMAYDAADGYALLYGGEFATGYWSNETWAFEDNTWVELATIGSPGPRSDAAMAYDAHDGEVVLFGGYAGSAPLPGTWVYRSGVWTKLPTIGAGSYPTPTSSPAMAYDAADAEIVLFGGLPSSGPLLNSTWTFAGGSWTSVGAGTAPEGSDGSEMSADPLTGGVLLHGGYTNSNSVSATNTTWLFRGGIWQNVTARFGGTSPASALGTAAADPESGAVVVYGGELAEVEAGPALLAEATSALEAPLSVGAPTSTPPSGSVDVGTPVTLSATVSGGLGGNTFTWGGLPPGCPSANATTVTCQPGTNGTYSVTLGVSGFLNRAVSAPLLLVVAPDPLAGAPSPSRTFVDIDQLVSFTATVRGGTAPLSFLWTALPPGCGGTGAVVTCAPLAAGTYPIRDTVFDGAGLSSLSPPLNFTVYPTLTVGAPTVETTGGIPGVADVGASASFTANVTAPGSGAPFGYSWLGLPSGCASVDGPKVTCALVSPGTSLVTVQVSDASGFQVVSPATSLTVNGPFTLIASVVSSAPTAGSPVTLLAQVQGGTGPYTLTWAFPGPGGATVGGALVTHTFGSAGTVAVTLTGVDATGAARDVTLNVTVAAAPAPATSSSGLSPGYWIALGVLGAVAFVGVGFGLAAWTGIVRRRTPPGAPPSPPVGPN